MRNKFLFFSGVIVYRILVDYVYVNFVSLRFSYDGYTYSENFINYCISWFLLIPFLLLIIPFLKRKEFVISNVVIFLFLLRFVPLTSFIACKPFSNSFVFAEIFFWSLLILLLRKRILPSKKYNFTFLNQNQLSDSSRQMLFNFILIFSCFVVLLISGVYTNFRLHFGLNYEVYELRSDAKTFNLPILLRYSLSMTKNILPVLFIYYWQEKKRWICYLIVFITLLNFSINGLKSTIFLLLLSVILQIIYNKKITFWYPALFAALCFFSLVEYKIFNTYWISDLLVRRGLFTPALLDSYYFDFISQHGPTYYQRGLHYVIGDIYFNSPEMQANNGLFSDAYTNLGYLGIIIYPLIYAIFFRFCETISRGTNKKFVMFAVIIIVNALNSTTFTTTLLTHGLLIVCLLLYIFPKKSDNIGYIKCKT